MNVKCRITYDQFTEYTGGLVPVNCGELYLMTDNTCVEVLRPETTGHVVPLIVLYKKLGNMKVELVYTNESTYTVYRFRGYAELHHYWSRNLPVNFNIDNGYTDILRKAAECWKVFF